MTRKKEPGIIPEKAQKKSSKKTEESVAARKPLTVDDIFEMVNADKRKRVEEREAHRLAILEERKNRKDRLNAALEAFLIKKEEAPDEEMRSEGEALLEKTLDNVRRRFTYRHGMTFVRYEDNSVPLRHRTAKAFAQKLNDLACSKADSLWQDGLHANLQKALKSQGGSSVVTLSPEIEKGIAGATTAADSISYIREIQRLLESQPQWRKYVPTLKTPDTNSQEVDIEQLHSDWDAEFAEYIKTEHAAFNKIFPQISEWLSSLEEPQRSQSREMLHAFIRSLDHALAVSNQISDAYWNWKDERYERVCLTEELCDVLLELLYRTLEEGKESEEVVS